MQILRPIAVGIVALLAACGGSADPTLPTTAPVAAASEPLVEFEANWMCQVQRFTFDDLSAIDAERDAALADAGFTAPEYQDFQLRLENDSELRSEVKDRFLASCDASEVVASEG